MMKRIETIAEMVMEGVVAADIGTDHAFLPILLARKNICPHIYACDVNEGPLKAARKNISANGMNDRITVILSDGFANVPSDAQCAVLAGMGFYTAKKILTEAGERIRSLKQIIVEVNRNVTELRRWISDSGYTILDEKTVYENGFDYVVISFDCAPHEPYTETEILCGPVLMKKREPEYIRFAQRKAQSLRNTLSKIPDPSSPAAAALAGEAKIWHNIADGN